MKKIVQSIALIAGASSLLSCNDKLNIAAPYKNITVVYGLLNQADTAHYIRIQKAFMDENQSAIDMAKVADSSFYSALSVSIKELNAAGAVINTLPLSKVDLANEGYPKATGAFFNTPSYAYKFKYTLNPANQYRVIILNTTTGNIDSAVTPIINNAGPFTSFGITEWIASGMQISFAKTRSELNKPLQLDYRANIPANVGAAELIIRFNWTDSNTTTGTSVRKFADYNTFSYKTATIQNSNPLPSNFDLTTPNSEIYDFLRNALGTPTSGTNYRYFDSCDMILYVAGYEYKRFSDLNSNKGGLTADEIRPMYTNVTGKDVMGLFSTRTFTQRLQIPISSDTRDSLRTNVATRDLNIRF